MVERCLLEVYVDGGWRTAAEVRVEDPTAGVYSPSRLEYDFDYVDGIGRALGARDHRAVSCRHPVTYEEVALERWPAFLLDIIPSGAGRRWWEARLRIPNLPRSDWELLIRGGGNPVGNVRVADAAKSEEAVDHAGFSREEVLERGADFIEYASQRGAWVAGGSGAGGDAPKLLLREDERGMLHADGALADARTSKAWLVKFPRSSRDADRMILRAEAAYHRIAARLGARASASPTWEADAFFMSRFDRIVEAGRVDRLGLESLYALAGVTDWGATVAKEDLASAVARFASDPRRELQELLLRDVLDVALGNTDNHGRNTAVAKNLDGRIELSPIYDFSPMVLDPEGIARVCRWRAEEDGFPDYAVVAKDLEKHGIDVGATKRWLVELGDRIAELPALMREEDVPTFVADMLERRVRRVASALRKIR